MSTTNPRHLIYLGALLSAGLMIMAVLLGNAAMRVKSLDRTVVVKGLSEREVPADRAIWPLTFRVASNDLNGLFETIQKKNLQIVEFLSTHGIARDAITIAPPEVMDRLAQAYGDTNNLPFRYTGGSTVTAYTEDVEAVRSAMKDVITLGKQGVALSGEGYQGQTQFVFSGLSALKPGMIEEATNDARGVAEKFAADSDSRLGKIKSASQGQFSIENRDNTTPHIKRVRVVSTVEYYLAD